MESDKPAPSGVCYRLSWLPSPLAFPEWEYCGGERFDDPSGDHAYRVLYTGERRTTFYESLAKFRSKRLAGLAAAQITQDWFDTHALGSLKFVDPGRQRWLDFRSPISYDAFDHAFADLFDEHGIDWFDASDATDENRAVSQAIGSWAFHHGYHGIEYMSRRLPTTLCWAIFEGTAFEVIEPASPIRRDDEDLIEVVRLWRLRVADP